MSFEPPIIVRVDPSDEESIIRTPHECLNFLLSRWRGKRNDKHRAAVQACSDAADGRKPLATARRAFLAAARDGGVLISGGLPDSKG
jgi:uncharacterized protein DUF982